MENTGRLKKLLTPTARRILFGQTAGPTNEDELCQIAQVDQAHLVMLIEEGIVDRHQGIRLLAAIDRLKSRKFEHLWNKHPGRGLFLLYEDGLAEMEGAEVAGILQTARSRNDLNATVLKLRLRDPYLRFIREALRFHAVLLNKCRKYETVVMPVYTHGQAAMPSTLSHYLLGIAKALLRNTDIIFITAEDLNSCPLGAGAATGTSFPINSARTAELLGFRASPLNSLEAVASRDFVLHLISGLAIYALTLSRLATDILQWSTAEFDFVRLPDELTGSSSAMPQKKNPFVLEHVQGRAASLLGAFMHASAAMHATPFTNSIAVGTEGVRPVWAALRDATEMISLIRLVIQKLIPKPQVMLRRTTEGFTAALEFANRLVRECNCDFRTAHRLIGEAVRESLETGRAFAEVASEHARQLGADLSFSDLSPFSIVNSYEAGGGPAPASTRSCWIQLRSQLAAHYRQFQSQKKHWDSAHMELARKCDSLTKKLSPSTVQ